MYELPDMNMFVHKELGKMNLPVGTHNFVVMALKQGKIMQRTLTKGKETWVFSNQGKGLIIEMLRTDKTITQKMLKSIGKKV